MSHLHGPSSRVLHSRSTTLVQKWVCVCGGGRWKRDKPEIRSGLPGQKRALSTQPSLKGQEPRSLQVEPPKGARSPDSQPPNTHGVGGGGGGEGAPSALRRVGVSGGSAKDPWSPAGRLSRRSCERLGGWRRGCAAAWMRVSVRREERPRSGRGTCETLEDSPPLRPSPRTRTGQRIDISLYCRPSDFRRERKPRLPVAWPSGDTGRAPSVRERVVGREAAWAPKPRWRGVCPRQGAPEARTQMLRPSFPVLAGDIPRAKAEDLRVYCRNSLNQI